MTTTNATNLFTDVVRTSSLSGNVVEIDGYVTTVASPAAGDDYQLLVIPGGTDVTQITFQNSDLDSGTTVTHGVGVIPVGGSAADYDEVFVAAGATWLRGVATTELPFIADLKVRIEEDSYLVVRLGGTFAGWAAGGRIAARVRGQVIGKK
jgi:hypothetical protein